MAKETNKCVVVTEEVRLSYVQLFEAKKFRETDAEGKYSVTILIDKATEVGQRTIKKIEGSIQAAAEKGAQKHFGGRIPVKVNHTLKDGDTETNDMGELKKDNNPELAGMMYMRLSTKYKPAVLDGRNNNQPILNPIDVFSGMYGRVSLTTFAYSADVNRGVSAVLNNVLITREGEPLTTHLTGDEFSD